MTEKTPLTAETLAFHAWCKRTLKWVCGLSALVFGGMLAVDFAVSYYAKDRIYTDINQLPHRPYALVLGTAKFYLSGLPNEYYKNRIDSAVEMFKARKADYFLLSGDNTTPYYNEPKVMLRDFKQRGVPAVMLKQDFAGYDTQASIIRADKTYHAAPFTIVSQRFHCERALMIAKLHDIDAICFVADSPKDMFWVRLRDFFARTGMVVDYVIHRQPQTLEIVKERTPTSG